MELSKEQLKQVTEWAQMLFTPEEIAIVLQVEVHALQSSIESRQGEAYAAYKRGQLLTIGKIRKAIIELAESGSSPAQTLAMSMIENLQIDERIN